MFRYKETVLNKPSNELGVRALELAVPQPDLTPLGRYTDQNEDDVEDRHYFEHVATSGGLVSLNNNGTVSWKSLKRNRVLELELVDLNGTKKLARKVRIESPLTFRDNCVTVVYDEMASAVVVDFITTNGFLYTIQVPKDEFDDKIGTKLTNQTAADWRSIKMPYSFDMKPPHLMHAVSANLLVVGTTDGNVVRFDRNSALDVVTHTIFQDSQSLSFSRLLPWNHADKVPGKPNLSLRTTVTMGSTHNLLFTLSINRMLRCWDLTSSQLVCEKDVVGKTEEQWLDPTPAKLIATNGDYIITFVPLEDDGVFKVWSKELDMLQEVQAQMPDKSAVWVAADIQVELEPDALVLWVAWKSDTSSCIQSLRIGYNGEVHPWLATQPWGAEDESVGSGSEHRFVKVDSKDESEYFIERLFGPGGFSLQTLKTALPIYAQHFSLPFEPQSRRFSQSLKGLKRSVCETVGAAVSMNTDAFGNNDYKGYQQDLMLQWTRFERLCSELEKQGHEALALKSGASGEVVLLKASFLGIIRPMSPMEVYWHNRSTDPSANLIHQVSEQTGTDLECSESLLKILEFMAAFRQGVSHTVMAHLHNSLREDYMKVQHHFTTKERIIEFYDEHFGPHLTDYAIGVLATQMAEIGNLDAVVAKVGELTAEMDKDKSGIHESSKCGITEYGSQLVCKAVYEHAVVCKKAVLDMLSLVVISSFHDDFVQEGDTAFAKLIVKLRELSCLTFALTNSNCNDTVSTFMENLVSVSYLNSYESALTLTADVWQQFMGTDYAASQLAVHMPKFELEEITMSEFVNEFVPPCDFFGAFIKGILVNDERWICKAAVGAGSETHTFSATKQGIVFDLVSPDIKLGQGLALYYQSVAKYMSEQKGDNALALKLAKYAVQTCPNDTDEPVQQAVFSTWFDEAIKARSFDDAYAALMELVPLQPVDSQVSTLVMSMLEHGQSARMVRYPFIGLANQVTSVLETEQLGGGSGGAQSRVLYAWKLTRCDYRGAAAALYNEIQRVRAASTQNFDQVRDLYETVLNSLAVIQPQEDRWIVVDSVEDNELAEQETSKRTRIADSHFGYRQEKRALKYKDVKEEYAAFVRGLEQQLTQLIL